MKNIRAYMLTQYGGPNVIEMSSIEPPSAQPGQVVVRVRAVGINGLDWKIREGYVRDAFPLQLPVVLGIELSGVVESEGVGVTLLKEGDRVMGPMGGLGAYAELVAVNEINLARVPANLDFAQAAALPVVSVSAWQSLNLAGPILPKQRILIHGAAGGLGGFAVQFARQAGAEIFATARRQHVGYVHRLGADHVIAYDEEHFEEKTSEIDLVLDYVGGEVLDRSWGVLAKNGVIVSTASPAIASNVPEGRRGVWFMNKPDSTLLQKIADSVGNGHLQSRVEAVVNFTDLPAAIERNRTDMQVGKTVAALALEGS